MKKEDIPQFIDDLTAVGAPVCAVGRERYIIGDSDIPEEQRPAVWDVCDRYETRDHLVQDIVAYLRSIGRFMDVSTERLYWVTDGVLLVEGEEGRRLTAPSSFGLRACFKMDHFSGGQGHS